MAVIAVIVFVLGLVGATLVRRRDRDRWPGAAPARSSVEVTDTGRPVPFEVTASGLPDAGLGSREEAAGVWTGDRYLVWGGWRGGRPMADGAAYDPATGAWHPIPAAPIEGRQGHIAVWTGTEMVVWGGSRLPPGRGQGSLADGAAYDPATSTWRPILPAPGLTAGTRPSRAAWVAGHLAIALHADDARPAPLALYDPETGTWRMVDAGFADVAAVGDLVVGVRADRNRPEDARLAAVDPDTGLVDDLGPLPVIGRIRRAGIAAVAGGVTVVASGDRSTHLATFDLGARRWTAVRRVGDDGATDPLAFWGSVVAALGDLQAADGQLAVVGAGSLIVFDPMSGTARAAGALNRVHCVRPNAATVWTGREWYLFGGHGACGGDAVGVRAHAARLTMVPPPPDAPTPGPWAGAAAGLMATSAALVGVLLVLGGRRRRHRGREQPGHGGAIGG